MKLNDFFDKAISVAIDNDPRGRDYVMNELENRKRDFEKLSDKEKLYFDHTSLTNPYSDSKIVYGEGSEEINTILTGIDIETGEVVLAEMLRQKGTKVDLLLAHHPSGRALANLYTVIGMQADILSLYGVPINVAESLLDARAKEVERKILPSNLMQTADAARLLKFPLICLHTCLLYTSDAA
ncbi:MAG: NGG1p interacting factor NIF3, partial [Thermodesulfovibrionales bacterium]|nr:NGG1p interacting factor NIF3 [Thermodesulfovibrionales bacterium]